MSETRGGATCNNSTSACAILAKFKNSPISELEELCKLQLCKNKRDTFGIVCEQMFPEFLDLMEMDGELSQKIPEASRIILVVLLAVILILSFGGNSLVILTFFFNNYMRSVTNVFILSLAVTDLLVSFTCIPLNIGEVLHSTWIFGKFGCKFLPCVTQFSIACSALTLCCIAFDRYYAIVHPLKLKFLQTLTRAAVLQIVVCLISAAIAVPQAFFYDIKDISACEVNDEERKEMCLGIRESTRRVFDIWISFFVTLLGPFLFMSIIYAIVCYKLWIQGPVGAVTKNSFDSRLKLKRRAIKMLLTVVFIFVSCWSPLLIFYVIVDTNGIHSNTTTANWRAFLQCLAMSSTCWNPLVYAFMNEKFRKAFRSLLNCKNTQVHPVQVRNNEMRMSVESRKTTTQLETPALPTGSRQTSETKL